MTETAVQRRARLDHEWHAEIRNYDAKQAAKRAAQAGPRTPATELERIRGLPPSQQRELARTDWPRVASALSGRRIPGQPLTAAELADLPKLLRESPELAADPERWAEITAALTKKEQTP